MGALAQLEFLKTTPTFGQNLAYFCIESAEGSILFSLASLRRVLRVVKVGQPLVVIV